MKNKCKLNSTLNIYYIYIHEEVIFLHNFSCFSYFFQKESPSLLTKLLSNAHHMGEVGHHSRLHYNKYNYCFQPLQKKKKKKKDKRKRKTWEVGLSSRLIWSPKGCSIFAVDLESDPSDWFVLWIVNNKVIATSCKIQERDTSKHLHIQNQQWKQ